MYHVDMECEYVSPNRLLITSEKTTYIKRCSRNFHQNIIEGFTKPTYMYMSPSIQWRSKGVMAKERTNVG